MCKLVFYVSVFACLSVCLSSDLPFVPTQVLMHLVNHLGHFPLGAGPSRLDSNVGEHEDNPTVDTDELSPALFSSPNVQVGHECV